MIGTVLFAVAKELIAQDLGLNMVQIFRNFANDNPPQSALPAATVAAVKEDPRLFVGGMERPEYTIAVSVSFLDYDTDLQNTSEELIGAQVDVYNIIDRVRTLFNRQRFVSEEMKTLVTKNNLITRAREGNMLRSPFAQSSENVVTYDMNISVMVTIDPNRVDDIPIEHAIIKNIEIKP